MASDIKLFNKDCLDAMKEMPDKAFDLAIVDPPYGIGNWIPQSGKAMDTFSKEVTQNNSIPNQEYFDELRRVSKHRIIWGANYYNCFEKGHGAIVWCKQVANPNFSKCEIASTTKHKMVNYVHILWQNITKEKDKGIVRDHPCQKPVDLYKWLLKNYAKYGDKILDTHLGSGSIAIACYDMGFDLTGYEIDKDYYDAAVKLLGNHKKQITFI